MQNVMSNSYLLSSSPVGKVCSDPALLFIIHYIYHFVLLMLDPEVCGALKHILLHPLPFLHSDLVLGQQQFHQHVDLHRCVYVPTWMVFHSRRLSRLPTASPSTFVHLLAVVVGGWCWGCGGLIGFMFACFMWTIMSV